MYQPLVAFLVSAGAVTLAEMGDKSQLLAVAFAAKYRPAKVLLGVFLASVLNHSIAVAAGSFIARYQDVEVWIQMIASLSFIAFGLWTIHGDKLEGDETGNSRFGPVMTVATAFFIAEFGDKTQLATMALAAKYPENPVYVLLGTTTGMFITAAVGIILTVLMCKRIPQRTIKLVSAGAFILFGLLGSYQVAVTQLNLGRTLVIPILIVIAGLSGLAAWKILKKK